MRVFEGSSNAPDASAAVEEALSSWHTTGDEAPDIIFAFCSTTQDAAQTFLPRQKWRKRKALIVLRWLTMKHHLYKT